MNRRSARRAWLLSLGGFLLLALPVTAAAAAEGSSLGWARSHGEPIGDIELPPDRVLEDPTLFKTLTYPAVVELDNGRELGFAANTAAVLESAPGGAVRLTVLSGQVTMRGRSGRSHRLGSGSFVVVKPATDLPGVVRSMPLEAPRAEEEP